MEYERTKPSFDHAALFMGAIFLVAGCGVPDTPTTTDQTAPRRTDTTREAVWTKAMFDNALSAGVLDTARWFNKSAPPKDFITATELKVYENDFGEAFYYTYNDGAGDIDMPILNVRRVVRWDRFVDLFKEQPAAVAVEVSYGISHASFVPLFQFLTLDGITLKRLPNAYMYDEKSESFQLLATSGAPTPFQALKQAYLDSVRVKRTLGASITNLVSNADPQSIIYPWKAKFESLVSDNHGEDTRLVFTCIAPETDLGPGTSNEFRHGLAVHVARHLKVHGSDVLIDLLDDTHVVNTTGASTHIQKAMDLGTLCPPSCPI